MQKRTPSSDDVKLTVIVDRATWRRLRDRAADQARSLNDLLNEWIEQQLNPPAAPPDSGRKGGTRYPSGGLPAARLCDRD